MKESTLWPLAVALALSTSAAAQTYVPIVVPPGPVEPLDINGPVTLQLPDDGKLYFSSIRVRTNGSLRFSPPPSGLNPPVYLLSTGDVVLDALGFIVVDGSSGTGSAGGAPGPGGFRGGEVSTSGGGAGAGPGGGAPGQAASHESGPASYGSPLLMPMVGGSGGGGSTNGGGGGGGGAITIASNTHIVVTNYSSSYNPISANAGSGSGGGKRGSGGSIRLVAPKVSSNGAWLGVTGESSALGQGRCRVDTLDRRSLSLFCGLSPLVMGSVLQVEPPVMPRLDLVEVAGQTVPGGSAFTTVLNNAPASQTVKVRAQDFFSGSADVRVRVTPYDGDATTYGPVTVPNNTTSSIAVTLPANVSVTFEIFGQETPIVE